jgi:hypothetical protein
MKKSQEGNGKKTILSGPTMGYADNLPMREMWRQIAEEHNGKFEAKHTVSRDLEMHHISIPHREWTIEISVSDSRPLRVNIKFPASLDFRFMLSQSDFGDKVFKLFSKKSVLLGSNEFNKRYTVKSNRSDLVKRLFSRNIMDAILRLQIYTISYQTNKKDRSAEMTGLIQRHAGSRDMMVELIGIFKEFIDRMEQYKVIQ